MDKIIECVPNFSEGKDKQTIEAIADAIAATPGCRLLDVDSGKSTNRTVYTFVADSDCVVEGALAAARVAREKIDMRRHHGEHPRMGALDVCPFIPVAGVTMDECVEISKRFGKRLADEFGVPVYLYEASATLQYRRKLPQIRKGQYEIIPKRIVQEKWKPDFGPARFVPEWGATVTGARFFFIAYNVNLLGTPNQAHRIALNLREAGRGPEQPGRLKEVKGMGWYVDDYNLAQVTVNLSNYLVTPPHILFEAVKEEAARLNVAVAGSEIVGVVPLRAILQAAEYYIEKEGLFILDEDQKVRLAVERLGLNSVAPFDPKTKIIEYIVATAPNEPLAGMSVRAFIEEVAGRSIAPGGGSVSAVIAALGAGLDAMVGKLTLGVRRFDAVDADMRALIPPLHEAAHALIPLIDADTDAFADYVAALGLPEHTDEENRFKKAQLQQGLKKAIEVPLSIMTLGDKVWDAMMGVTQYGNIASRSDLEVGARALEVGIWGAYRTVVNNMGEINDPEYRKKIMEKADAIRVRAVENCQKILDILEKRPV
ncbi:glutamate formimidoyltransferase [Desulfobacter hydrogenophilus]|uniref:Formimidoyltransferase-cyclodeaminase n=1 Tax=Desulfobacter hydrogenophilus TaxID=2291 RepID=A0A328FBJ3_9BACT|nr:glutamate formimidoyltransferase [Desulfobacter hydrogenophilus]NDY73741.1 glutamate formimidoyltransferase [Desulfobacter hydrogenophilus]QBH13397.1 glutamate formimidoyltransferase [Desulfobacter hydrogenophilus]RAM00505.1 glutamate formimidoyltransferase [Desulfobacter hydrogenophilus]